MKTVIITGANAGIGFATARHLASLSDWHVVLACRNKSKAEAATYDIRRDHPTAHIDHAPLDLFSLNSVRQFPAHLRPMALPPLHGLILNAGGINMKAKIPEFTDDRFERTFQLNFLGHFLLANLLLDHLAEPARIIFVSSDLHDPSATRMGRLRPPVYGPLEDAAYAKATALDLHPMSRYATAKMYAMMTAYELDRHLRRSHRDITVNSFSPGVIPTTQAGRDMPLMLKAIMTSSWFVNFMGSHLSTEQEAAENLTRLLTDPALQSTTGKYFDGPSQIPSSEESRDTTKSQSVWTQASRLANLAPEPTSNRGRG